MIIFVAETMEAREACMSPLPLFRVDAARSARVAETPADICPPTIARAQAA